MPSGWTRGHTDHIDPLPRSTLALPYPTSIPFYSALLCSALLYSRLYSTRDSTLLYPNGWMVSFMDKSEHKMDDLRVPPF